MSTAQAVLAALSGYGIKQEGPGRYRLNSPLRPGSNSHAFSLTIEGDEKGAFYDHVSGDKGSLYELAAALGIQVGRHAVQSTKRGYTGMVDYAHAHGITAEDMKRWMWREVVYKGRPALEFATHTGRRWRFLDGQSPHYISEKGYKPSWYGLSREVAESVDEALPLVICNGEISVVAGQAHGLAAVCVTAGEKGRIAPELVEELVQSLMGDVILVAMDCDATGRKSAAGITAQLVAAGFKARAVDLGLTDGGDLADFCMLHGSEAHKKIASLPALPDGEVSAPIIAPARDFGVPKDKVIGAGRSWLMLHSDDLRYLPRVSWLLKPYIPSQALVVVYGPSGAGKSFFALWLALQMAQAGHDGIYMAYEGEYGYQARVRAAQAKYGYKRGLVFTLGQVDLMSDDDFSAWIDAARRAAPAVVFVDTMSRSMGDLDENSTRDMNSYVRRCNLLMSELKCSVVLIHHTNKGGAVERGSGVMRGAADVMIRLEDADHVTIVECAKTKDGKPFPSFHIALEPHDTGLADDAGLPVYTPVVVMAETVIQSNDLTVKQRAILSVLAMDIHEDGLNPSDIEAVVQPISRSTLYQALNSLMQRGYIKHEGKREPYAITAEGKEALNPGKPWVAPTETPTPATPLSKGTLPGMPKPVDRYREAGL